MSGRFEGKVAIVTGATSGIGMVAAQELAREGARVVMTGRRAERGKAIVEEIKAAGGEALFIQADVSHRESISRMIEETVETYGRLDLAFNNAGIVGSGYTKAADITEDHWDRVMAVNVTGVWLCMKHEIHEMLKSGGGAIVNNASIYGLRGSHIGAADYITSKHAVMGLTKTAAMDYARRGIRVNAICPGFTHSEMVDSFADSNPEGFDRSIIPRVPMRRIGETREVTSAVLWMLSDEASFMTGQAIVPDGGWTAS